MKRALRIIGVMGVTALITYLFVTRQQAQDRAAQLNQALMDAEARVIQLQEDIESAKQRLAEMAEARQAARLPAPPFRKAVAVAPSALATPAALPEGGPAITYPAMNAGVDLPVAPPLVVGPLVRYTAFGRPGLTNLVRIEGTSNIHDWQAEGHIIGGTAELGAAIPTEFGAQALPGTVDARINVSIPVRSLQTVDLKGRPLSDTMDEVMYGMLLAKANPLITYTLTSLTLKEQPREMTGSFLYEATGKLAVAGRTNTVIMPVAVSPRPGGRIQLSGSVKVRMTDFNITPPVPKMSTGTIKTGDEVTLKFVWWVNRANAGPAGR